MNRTVAIKQLDRRAQIVISDVAELQVPGRLENEYIVTIYDVLVDSGAIVMEYVERGSLLNLMQTDMPWVRANFVRLMVQICEALRAAHSERIIHRDIKPDNILVTQSGDVRVADFGVCKFLDSVSHTDGLAGTPAYMAPEVLEEIEYGTEADIHSLGCLMYQIWAGRTPWVANGQVGAYLAAKSQGDPVPLRLASANVDDILNELVQRMLTSGESRIRNVDTVVQQLAYLPDPARINNSIDDLQLMLGAIYGYVNANKDPLYLLAQYSIAVRRVSNELMREAASSESVERSLVKAFAWLCASATSIDVRLGELAWLKYGDVCPYCEQDRCVCPRSTGDQRQDPSERNARLLERMRNRQVNQAPPPRNFKAYQAMFERIFGERNRLDGIESISLHAFSEIAEAMDAYLHALGETDADSLLVLHLEFSDLVAWFYAFLNVYSNLFDFQGKFLSIFDTGCYACNRQQCKCPDPLGIEDWRRALRLEYSG